MIWLVRDSAAPPRRCRRHPRSRRPGNLRGLNKPGWFRPRTIVSEQSSLPHALSRGEHQNSRPGAIGGKERRQSRPLHGIVEPASIGLYANDNGLRQMRIGHIHAASRVHRGKHRRAASRPVPSETLQATPAPFAVSFSATSVPGVLGFCSAMYTPPFGSTAALAAPSTGYCQMTVVPSAASFLIRNPNSARSRHFPGGRVPRNYP